MIPFYAELIDSARGRQKWPCFSQERDWSSSLSAEFRVAVQEQMDGIEFGCFWYVAGHKGKDCAMIIKDYESLYPRSNQ